MKPGVCSRRDMDNMGWARGGIGGGNFKMRLRVWGFVLFVDGQTEDGFDWNSDLNMI